MAPSPEERFASIAETQLDNVASLPEPVSARTQWLSVPVKAGRRWPALVAEARAFVAKGARETGG